MAGIPLGCQGRERLGLFAPVNLGFDPRGTASGSGRTVRSRSLLGTIHIVNGLHKKDRTGNRPTLPRPDDRVQTP